MIDASTAREFRACAERLLSADTGSPWDDDTRAAARRALADRTDADDTLERALVEGEPGWTNGAVFRCWLDEVLR